MHEEFRYGTSAHQGCGLSPAIFSYAINWVMGITCHNSRSLQVNPEYSVTDLEYVDDMVRVVRLSAGSDNEN